jgi:hypothetical protein
VPKISDGFFLQSTVPIVNSYQANGNTAPFLLTHSHPLQLSRIGKPGDVPTTKWS